MKLSLEEKFQLMKQSRLYRNNEIETYTNRIRAELFPKQLEIFNDVHRRKIVIAGRRFGKTNLNGAILVAKSLHKNAESFYINMTQTEAQAQMLPVIEHYREITGVKGEMHLVAGIYKFETGATIRFSGYDSIASQRKVQGKKITGIFILDEVQSAPNLRVFLDTYIRPMTADSPLAQLMLTGTPPRYPGSYVEHLWFDPNASSVWRKFNYGMKDNPLIQDRFEQIVYEICQEKGLIDNNNKPLVNVPFIQREYFGNMAAFDTEATVFETRKYFDEPPKYDIDEIAIGVDFGFSNSSAIVGLAFNTTDKQGWVFYEDKFNQTGAEETILRMKAAYVEGMKLFQIFGKKPKINCYVDHSHQQISYDATYRYQIPCKLATKVNKQFAIDQLKDYCRSGRFQMKQHGLLDNEMKTILYKRDENDNIIPEFDATNNGTDHFDLTDAFLYASRRFSQAIGTIPLEK